MNEINKDGQHIILLFPDETTDGEPCWIAEVPPCPGLIAQGENPEEALPARAEFFGDYERHMFLHEKPLPPEKYTLVERVSVRETSGDE